MVRLSLTVRGDAMLETRLRGLHCTLAAAAGLLLATAAAAQAPREQDIDYAGQIRRMNEIAGQKIESDIRSTLREAQRLTPTDPAQAVERLQSALARLTDDTALLQPRREALKRMLQDRIRVTETEGKNATAKDADKAQDTARRATDERRNADQARLARILGNIKLLQTEGKTEEAGRQAEELARQHPNNPAAQAVSRTTSVAEQLASARRLQDERERRLLGVTREIDRSATPPVNDMDFPKDWKERTKNRTATVPLTAKEKVILQALDAPVSVNFRDSRFEAVIDYLQTYTGQPIVVDGQALKEAEITYDTPVTVRMQGVTLRTLLRKILGDLGLTYVVKEQTIQVTTAEKAKNMMIVRTYYIGDVVSNPAFGGINNYRFGPAFNQLQMVQSANQIIELIQNALEPDSWHTRNGPGSITFHWPTMSLVIRQSAEVHALLGGGLLR